MATAYRSPLEVYATLEPWQKTLMDQAVQGLRMGHYEVLLSSMNTEQAALFAWRIKEAIKEGAGQ
jgi:hypothetical protein